MVDTCHSHFRCPYCDKGFTRANHRDDHIMGCDKLTEEQMKAEMALQRHAEGGGGAKPRAGELQAVFSSPTAFAVCSSLVTAPVHSF